MSSTNNIIASSTATVVAEIATLPICTIKTNYQNSQEKRIRYVTTDIYRKYGIRGFYSASIWSISSQTVSTAAKYFWYRFLLEHIPNKFVAGCASGILGSLFSHPFDVLKMHAQTHTKFIPEFKKYGPQLFYRGYSKTFSKYAIGSTLYFPLFDTFNDLFKNKLKIESPTLSAMASSITTATMATTIMQPIDYMKTRHVMGNTYNHLQKGNIIQAIKPYYKGLSLNLFRVVPHFCITMTVIDIITNYTNN